MPTFDSPQPISADIRASVGHVEITATDAARTVVEIVPTNASRSGDASLAREATATFTDGTLRVQVPKRLSLFGQSDSVDLRIELPTGSRIDVDSAYGSVRVRGRVADARVRAKYGSTSVEHVSGDLVLAAPYGDVDVARVDGRLELTAGHGHVRIDRIGGEARARGSHGTIDLGTTEGAVEVTTSGPLTIERALADVTARSAHGAIRVLEADGGRLRLENGYAEIEVGVRDGVAAWVDAVSAHGAVRTELTPGADGAGGDRTVELHLRANWADILIRRAARRP